MLQSVELSDYMLANPSSVSPDMTVYEAALKILKDRVSGVVVTNNQKEIVGMLSELDCLRAILSSAYNNDASFGSALVSDIMTEDVLVHSPSDDVISVAQSMLDKRHRRRPVVDGKKLVGQVTCRQILNIVTSGLSKRT